MRAVTPRRPRRTAGFTLIEALVVIAIIGVLAAVGLPNMSSWLLGHRVQSAAGYYMDGFQRARAMAIEYGAASRLVLSENAKSGQMQWQVDMCFPNQDDGSGGKCDDQGDGSWSTLTTAVTDPADTTRSVKSVTNAADGLPLTNVMAASLGPNGATAVYFNRMGWLNNAVTTNLTRVTLSPSYQRPNTFAPVAVALTLAGVASRCNPSAATTDPKGCPP